MPVSVTVSFCILGVFHSSFHLTPRFAWKGAFEEKEHMFDKEKKK